MSRPTSMKVDGTVYWTLMTYDADGILVDADSTPTVAVRKNGASVADAVTVTKRSATTGIYDCSHNPAGEAEGDTFGYEENVTISSQAYLNPWSLEVEAVEAGGGSGGGGDATAANQTTIINAISGLNDFNPATDTVANVTLVGTTTTNTDMRGTDGANTVAPVDVSSDVTAILADTNELQLNQNNWLTATGFSTFDASTDTVTTDTASRDASKADVSGLSTFDASTDQVVASNMRGTDGANTIAPVDVSSDVAAILADTNELQLNQGNWLTATGFNTVAPDNASIATILADTNELQQNQGDWATATGFSTHGASDVVTAMQVVANDFKADVSGVATQASVDVIDSICDNILLDTNELQGNQGDWATADVSALLTASAYTSSLPTNFGDLAVEVTTGKVTTANPASGSGSSHTAADVVTAMQAVADDFKADVTGVSTHDAAAVVAAMQTVAADFKADVSGLSTHTASDVVTAMQAVANLFKADVSGLSIHSAADVVAAMQSVANDFKADTSGLSTHDEAAVVTAMLAVADSFKANVTSLTATVDQIDVRTTDILEDTGTTLPSQISGINSNATTLRAF